jgi:hypothetical protein
MPALSQPAAVPQFPIPNTLPPAIEYSLPAQVGAGAGLDSPLPGPIVRAKRSQGEVTDRLRRRSNPLVIVFAVVMAIVLIAFGIVAHRANQAYAARREFERQMVGNWELVPGQSQLERWDFAFHSDGHLQMALGNELNDGQWRVTSVQGTTGYVLINWPDDAPQTLRVRLQSGTMQISLEGVGSFAFRVQVP